MNYSKSISKDKIAKRILLSWAVVAVVFAAIGGAVGWYFGKNDAPPAVNAPLHRQESPMKERMRPAIMLPKVINL